MDEKLIFIQCSFPEPSAPTYFWLVTLYKRIIRFFTNPKNLLDRHKYRDTGNNHIIWPYLHLDTAAGVCGSKQDILLMKNNTLTRYSLCTEHTFKKYWMSATFKKKRNMYIHPDSQSSEPKEKKNFKRQKSWFSVSCCCFFLFSAFISLEREETIYTMHTQSSLLLYIYIATCQNNLFSASLNLQLCSRF